MSSKNEVNESMKEKQDSFQKLRETVNYAKKNSPFYSRVYATLQDDFNEEQFAALPFTTKTDLTSANRDFLCVPVTEVAEYCTTSGTSGEPITIYLTKKDLKRLAKNEADSFRLTGAKEGDLFQLMTTIDKQFMAGMAYFLGVQELNAGIIRIGPGVPELQWKSILKNQPSILIAVPSFIITLLNFAKNNQIDFRSSNVKKIVCIGEALRNDDMSYNILAKRILDEWDVQLYSTYASTEMAAAFTECEAQCGGHLNEELLYLEVIGEDGKQVLSGEVGELVISTLGTEGTPLIRYKTGDIARLFTETCSCGRTSPRIGPVLGRKNQMIKYKGTTIYPKAIFDVLDEITQNSIYKVEITKDELGNDQITILLDEVLQDTETFTQLINRCKAILRVVPLFVFHKNDYIRNQVFKPNLRKPEKIIFIN